MTTALYRLVLVVAYVAAAGERAWDATRPRPSVRPLAEMMEPPRTEGP